VPEGQPIRIVLVEDHTLLREALARTLAADPGFSIVGEFAGVDGAIEAVTRNQVDIVLLDINLGSEQGGSFLNRARTVGYSGKVLVVTAGISEREAAWLLNRGCSGICLKTEPLSQVAQRIRDIVAGTGKMDRESVKAVLGQVDGAEQNLLRPLTPREREVLRGVCEGLANKEIGVRLNVSENTVKSFVQQLFEKTGVRTRAGLVAAAIEQYWDQIDSP
jgi:two-component system nitrate/nitrite response regulator NarL